MFSGNVSITLVNFVCRTNWGKQLSFVMMRNNEGQTSSSSSIMMTSNSMIMVTELEGQQVKRHCVSVIRGCQYFSFVCLMTIGSSPRSHRTRNELKVKGDERLSLNHWQSTNSVSLLLSDWKWSWIFLFKILVLSKEPISIINFQANIRVIAAMVCLLDINLDFFPLLAVISLSSLYYISTTLLDFVFCLIIVWGSLALCCCGAVRCEKLIIKWTTHTHTHKVIFDQYSIFYNFDRNKLSTLVCICCLSSQITNYTLVYLSCCILVSKKVNSN